VRHAIGAENFLIVSKESFSSRSKSQQSFCRNKHGLSIFDAKQNECSYDVMQMRRWHSSSTSSKIAESYNKKQSRSSRRESRDSSKLTINSFFNELTPTNLINEQSKKLFQGCAAYKPE